MTSPISAPHYDIAKRIDLDVAQTELTLGTNLFVGGWGAKAVKQVLIQEGVAPPSDLVFTYEQIAIQVLTRGKKNEAERLVYERAKKLSNYLLNLPDNFDANGCEYTSLEPTSNIAHIGKDENEREVYTMNFTAYRAGAR